jgi:aspartyl-tRNA(Asn)/glutamyl-tRNA(Gln) amidotransferase subunit A
MREIVELSQLLANRKITSRQLVEQALAAIKDPQGEGSRTFLSVHESEALADADQVDAQRRDGANLHTLAGIPISIKNLFDEAGFTTLATRQLSAPSCQSTAAITDNVWMPQSPRSVTW